MSPSDFTADLPAPRDDEPESLRTDIIDELADHLQCAIRREELRPTQTSPTTEPRGLSPWPNNENDSQPSSCGRSPDRATQTAFNRALARFGNPAAIARKLWWDAMWEKIMTQRILTGLNLLTFAACCIIAVLMWQMRQMQTAQRDLLAESQQQNAKLLGQFQTLASDLKASAQSEALVPWFPVLATLKTESGSPVQGTASLSGTAIAGGEIQHHAETNRNGVADFGSIPAGEYRLTYRLEDLNMSDSTSLFVGPGRHNQVEVLCPDEPPGQVELKFDVQPPDDLAEVPLYYFAHITFEKRKFHGDFWNVHGVKDVVLLIDAQGEVLGQTDYDRVTYYEAEGQFSSTHLANQLAPEFPLADFESVPAYSMRVNLWPYVRDPAAQSETEGSRPPLKRLRGAALISAISAAPEPGRDSHTVTVDASHKEFWHDIIDDLVRIDRYKQLKTRTDDRTG